MIEAGNTPGFELPNPHIIHARAASYINDDHPDRYLDLAVGQTLRVAKEAGIKTLAMPAIGTGVFNFPPELAAGIIVKALLSRASEHPEITLVPLVLGLALEAAKSLGNAYEQNAVIWCGADAVPNLVLLI